MPKPLASRWASALSLAVVLSASAQTAQKPKLPPPDVANVSYGPHERNVLDLWKAKSAKPTPLVIFIHGGGFRAGDKSNLSLRLLEECLKSGISVAAINYRFTQHAPFPAPMQDGARAVQYLRMRAAEWNLDPKRFAATGGSAGACMSLWIGFHDDMADPASPDPVRRQSTRLAAMGVQGAQTTVDPRVIAKLIGEATARHPGLEPFYGLKGDELATQRAYRIFEEASPVNHLSKDDPPVLLIYSEPDVPLPADAKPGAGIHHPRFGFYLKERMDKLGIECTVRILDTPEKRAEAPRLLAEFFRRHLF